jgi:2-polyprenyl-6-methoxyphenol hydroxylase-like FAD-dependent oxidoreductase
MRVLISGAGIAGCTLAYCLQRHGIQSTLIEKSPAIRAEGYMVDFFGSGYDVAEKLGLLRDLEQIHYGIGEIAFVGSNGKPKFSVPYAAVRKLFDGRHFNFMRGDLEHVLFSKLADSVEVRFGVEIDSVGSRPGGCTVNLSDGANLEGDLLVGADGIHSKVRALCFGEESRFLRYLRCNTAATVLERLPSLECSNGFITFTVPGRQVAVYPIRGGRLASFFLHSSDTPPLPPTSSAAAGELQARYKDLNWVVPELLRSINDRDLYFDAVSQVVMPAWSKDNVVLLGDAAYCVSLIAGQGASLAMAGAFLLAEELSACSDIRQALTRYERRLKPAIEKKQAAGRKMVDWFLPNSSLRLAMRDTIMRLSALPVARSLVKRAISPESVLAPVGPLG